MAHCVAPTQIFFATPHRLRGPDAGKRLAADILRAVGNYRTNRRVLGSMKETIRPVKPTHRMLEEIQRNSTNLSDISANFLDFLRWFNIAIVNFIESDITEGLDRVVSFDCWLPPNPASSVSHVNLGLHIGCERR
jgi:hypothetical protein